MFQELKCMRCGFNSVTFQHFLDLQLDIECAGRWLLKWTYYDTTGNHFVLFLR